MNGSFSRKECPVSDTCLEPVCQQAFEGRCGERVAAEVAGIFAEVTAATPQVWDVAPTSGRNGHLSARVQPQQTPKYVEEVPRSTSVQPKASSPRFAS